MENTDDTSGSGVWSLGRRAHELLDDVGKDIALDLAGVTGVASVVAVVLVGACRLVLTFTVERSTGALGWIGGGVIGAVALGALVVLAWIYWQTRLDLRNSGWYAIALIWSILVIGLAVEAFAGATTLLWRSGVIDAASGRGPSLWLAEHHYLWHLADSVPLLDIPETLGWPEPVRFDDARSGVLLLAFQLVLVAPLVRIGLGAYQLFEAGVVARRVKEGDLAKRGIKRGYSVLEAPSVREVWGAVLRLGGLVVAGGALLVLLADPQSPLNRQVEAWTESDVMVADRQVDLGWVSAVPSVAAVAALAVVLGGAYLSLEFRGLTSVDRPATVAGALSAYLLLITLIVVAGAVLTVTALRLGLADTDPSIRGPAWAPVVEGFSWHLVDALPGPDVAATLRWEPDHDLRGSVSGALVLVGRLAMFCVLLFPLARALRSYSHHSRPRPPTPASLLAARQLLGQLWTAQEAMLAYQHAVATKGAADRPREDAGGGADLSRLETFRANWDAQSAIDQVLARLDDLVTLFGAGPVSSAADTAAAELSQWHKAVRDFDWGRPRSLREPFDGTLRTHEDQRITGPLVGSGANRPVPRTGRSGETSRPRLPPDLAQRCRQRVVEYQRAASAALVSEGHSVAALTGAASERDQGKTHSAKR